MNILCVVENGARRGSRYWGEHGLAYRIEHGGRRVLFDTGQSGLVLLHNLALSGETLVDCIGERAFVALAHAFGDLVQPFPAGTRLVFG